MLGGNLPSLFVGCRVSAEVEAAHGQTRREQGVLVRWDGAEDSDAVLLLDSQLSELRLLTVSRLQLLAIDELSLPPDSFALSPQLVSSFGAFLPKRPTTTPPSPAAAPPATADARPPLTSAGSRDSAVDPLFTPLDPALEASFLFGLLQTRALKALQGLLRVEAAKTHVLEGGLLPSILASAAMPVPLVGLHQSEVLHTDAADPRCGPTSPCPSSYPTPPPTSPPTPTPTQVLQTHVAMLEQMHREVSPTVYPPVGRPPPQRSNPNH